MGEYIINSERRNWRIFNLLIHIVELDWEWDLETWHYAKHAPRSKAQKTFDVQLSFAHRQ